MMQKAINGHVIVVMAPMGSGKGTLIRHALEVLPELKTTVSCTTRSVRPGEVDGREYHFISPEEFDRKVEAGEFLEWAHFGLNRYGTLKSEIMPALESGQIVVVEMEVQGVEQLHKILPKENMTAVYIEAGGWDVLKARALARAPIDEVELEKRHERYLAEIEFKQHADVIIDNSSNDFTSAKEDFIALINEVHNKIENN